MRICHVIESAAMGSGNAMLTLAELGARAGHDVTVVYSPKRASAQFLERSDTIRDVRFVPIAMTRMPQPHDLLAVARLRAFLRRDRFDVVHSHSSKAGALARLAGVGLGAVQVYSPHGFVTMNGDPGRLFGIAERLLGRLSDAVVAVSEKERSHGLGLGIAPARITVIPNGIDEELIAPSSPGRSAQAPFTVGFVGRLSEQKNPLLALEAFRQLLSAQPASRLVVIGGGELGEAVAAGIDALGLASRVTLVGERSAFGSYPEFDVLLCSSRFEGMPLTFLEALAHGLPIVSTDVGGVDELIDQGETGHICASSADALGAGLAAIAARGPADRSRMRDRAIEKARQFTTRATSARTIDLYERLLSAR